MIQIQKFKNYLGILLIIFSVFFITGPILATQFILESDMNEMAPGQLFELKVFINTESEDINALEGEIVFPVNKLAIQEIRNGDSIINLWIQEPITKDNKINFSGIIPGGRKVKKGLVFSVIIKVEEGSSGEGVIDLENYRILLNDGLGTETETEVINWSFEISEQEVLIINKIKEINKRDQEYPEKFTPIIIKIPEIGGDQYLLIFSTTDKLSGIDHYEVQESGGDFITVSSPYILQNQELDEKIIIKAVDKAGNERIVTVAPVNSKPWYQKYNTLIITILISLIVILLFLFRYFHKGKNKSK